MSQPEMLVSFRSSSNTRAIVFVHGFAGDPKETWGRFPEILMGDQGLADWDVFSFGYRTRKTVDIRIWSADPSLSKVSQMLGTTIHAAPLAAYSAIAFIKHSSGGLALQRLLVDTPEAARRISHVFLFGTPSLGSAKVGLYRWLKTQIADLAVDGPFLKDLRERWNAKYGSGYPFRLFVIAGSEDSFVDEASVFKPFPVDNQRVVPGNHVEMIRPASENSLSYRLVADALLQAPETRQPPAPKVAKNTSPSHAVTLPARHRNRVFVSYSHKDHKLLEELEIALSPDIRAGAIDVWDDTKIKAGKDWKSEIQNTLAEAGVGLLLVSQDFLASDFIASDELPDLLKAAEDETVQILWIPASASNYEATGIAKFQAVIDPKKPLDQMTKPKRKAALVEIAKAIEDAVKASLTAHPS
jgi:pimeloyl-ACP methyl ester carboxylesterase